MPFEHRPQPETLAEFPLYQELLTECGKQDIALQDALIGLAQREAAGASRRPTRADLERNIPKGGPR